MAKSVVSLWLRCGYAPQISHVFTIFEPLGLYSAQSILMSLALVSRPLTPAVKG